MPAASPLRAVLEAQQTEDDMRDELVKAATIGGWAHMHIRDSRGQDATDYPDDWFLRGGRMYWWELKSARGKPTPGQTRMLAALNTFIDAHGLGEWCEARVVRPADMADCLDRLLERPGLAKAKVM